MSTHFFTAVFSAVNHSFKGAVVETGDKFSIIYIFITLFVNNMYFRVHVNVNNVSNFVFYCKKTKQSMSKSYF